MSHSLTQKLISKIHAIKFWFGQTKIGYRDTTPSRSSKTKASFEKIC